MSNFVFVVDLLPFDWVSGIKLCVFVCQAKQHGPLQVHPQFGVQVFFWCLTGYGLIITHTNYYINSNYVKNSQENAFCHTGVVFPYFKNVKVKSIGSINEVQCTRCDCYGEFVVENLTVQLSLQQLWFPGLPETSRQLQNETIQEKMKQIIA